MSLILGNETSRPRDVDAKRAASILYGDWGTSKAYVIGLAFAVAGYSSFWLIAAMCCVTGLVALNYVIVCKHYPNGGGVYASVRHRSEVISIVGAFLLIADYIVTAALSALSAFEYVGLSHPEIYAALSIAIIGALNLLGPKHTGGLAVAVSVPTFIVVIILAIFCVPHLPAAIHHLEPLGGGFLKNWNGLVAIVLALSGVEAIANATGVMKLDPGSTPGQSERDEDRPARVALDRSGSLLPDGVPRPGDARVERLADRARHGRPAGRCPRPPGRARLHAQVHGRAVLSAGCLGRGLAISSASRWPSSSCFCCSQPSTRPSAD